jgi:hypothetical protein
MCNKCDEIDKIIARYRWLKGQITDQQTQQAADQLMLKLEAEKSALHLQLAASK